MGGKGAKRKVYQHSLYVHRLETWNTGTTARHGTTICVAETNWARRMFKIARDDRTNCNERLE